MKWSQKKSSKSNSSTAMHTAVPPPLQPWLWALFTHWTTTALSKNSSSTKIGFFHSNVVCIVKLCANILMLSATWGLQTVFKQHQFTVSNPLTQVCHSVRSEKCHFQLKTDNCFYLSSDHPVVEPFNKHSGKLIKPGITSCWDIELTFLAGAAVTQWITIILAMEIQLAAPASLLAVDSLAAHYVLITWSRHWTREVPVPNLSGWRVELDDGCQMNIVNTIRIYRSM